MSAEIFTIKTRMTRTVRVESTVGLYGFTRYPLAQMVRALSSLCRKALVGVEL